MKTPWEIQYEAFLHAGGIYTEKHAGLYADLANDHKPETTLFGVAILPNQLWNVLFDSLSKLFIPHLVHIRYS